YDAVRKPDFLSLGIGSPVITNRHFVDRTLELRYFCDDFNFKSKPARRNNQIANDVSAESFVTGFDVRQIQIREHVRKKSQQLVPEVMIEIQNARGAPHQES